MISSISGRQEEGGGQFKQKEQHLQINEAVKGMRVLRPEGVQHGQKVTYVGGTGWRMRLRI